MAKKKARHSPQRKSGLTLRADGNVGLGTNAPYRLFDNASGDLTVSGNVVADNFITTSTTRLPDDDFAFASEKNYIDTADYSNNTTYFNAAEISNLT